MVGIVVMAILIISLLAISGCGSTTTPAASATPGASTVQTSSASETETIKIGLVCNFGWPLGLDMIRSTRVLAAMDNAAGGWEIGGKKYKVQVIEYDSKNTQTTETAAVNRLIFEDKVKFILFDNNLADSCLPTTEANKVIALEETPTPVCLMPANHYSFGAALVNCQYAALPAYFAKAFPNAKTLAGALPDNQIGHAISDTIINNFKLVGIDATLIYFPETATDLSALGTKVKTLNPDLFCTGGDAIPYKAVYDAGYRGQMISTSTATFASTAAIAGATCLEGEVNAAWPVEFDPALTSFAQTFKEAYIKANGQWDAPEIQCTAEYSCLKAALIKAGTVSDTDKIAEVIGSGLQFEALNGTCQMVARPDLGNTRTVDSVVAYYIKKVVNGKITQLDTLKIEDVVAAFAKANPAK